MMSGGEWLSAVINLAVGVYLAWFYPRSLRARLGAGRMPPFFVIMLKIMPPFGFLLLAATLLYVGLRLSGNLA